MAVKIEKPAFSRYIYYYGKVIGLSPFTFDNNGIFKVSKLGCVYNVFLIAMSTYGFLKALESRFQIQYPKETKFGIIIDAIGITLKYGAIVSLWFLLGFRQNSLKKLFEFLGFVERRSIILYQDSWPVKLTNNWRNFTCNLLLVIFLFTFSQVYAILIEKLYKNYPKRSTEWIIYSFFEIVMYIFMIIFIEVLAYFSSHYSCLNKKLSNLLQNESNISVLERHMHSIACLHDGLGTVVETFVNFFSFPMLLIFTVMFVQLCIDLHLLYNFNKYVDNWNNKHLNAFITQLFNLGSRLTVVYFICNVTEATCSEARRTICILNKSCNRRCQDLKTFKNLIKVTVLQLHQRKLKVSLLGLLDVDCYILGRFTSSLVMYIVFMFQLDSLVK